MDHNTQPTTLQHGALPPGLRWHLPSPGPVQESGTCNGVQVAHADGEGNDAATQPLTETPPMAVLFPRQDGRPGAALVSASLPLVPLTCKEQALNGEPCIRLQLRPMGSNAADARQPSGAPAVTWSKLRSQSQRGIAFPFGNVWVGERADHRMPHDGGARCAFLMHMLRKTTELWQLTPATTGQTHWSMNSINTPAVTPAGLS